ncbi:MAG: hypothetical protein HGB05_04580, partial [Chloroflexi bacterium]|nr:hypothetical protein [Chloroflexota bacterium]
MRRIITSTAPAVITGIAGSIVLLSFIFPVELLLQLRVVLINIAVIVAGMALLLGFVRLLSFHLRRVQQRRSGYSLVALIVAIVVFGVLVADRFLNLGATTFVFTAIIAPIQSSLGALLAIFLGVAALRMAQRRRTWGTLWFLISAIVVLLTQIPVTADSVLLPIRQFFDALAMGGLRG